MSADNPRNFVTFTVSNAEKMAFFQEASDLRISISALMRRKLELPEARETKRVRFKQPRLA